MTEMKAPLNFSIVLPQDPPVEEQMLRALELFHYGNRFRDELFVIAVPGTCRLADLALDLRLLHAAEVWTLLIVEPGEARRSEVEQLSKRGLSLVYLSAGNLGEHSHGTLIDAVQEELALSHIPVVCIGDSPNGASVRTSDLKFPEESLWKTASLWGTKLRARKLFFLSQFRGIENEGRLVYQISPTDIEHALSAGEVTNVGAERLTFLLQENIATGMAMTLLEEKAGRLFLEVFTHRGKGTLLTKHYPDQIRRGRLEDVTELSLLMRPSILAGLLLPTSDDEIAEHVEDFFIYTVNEALVACARLTHYGDGAELAKFCTLPRYQGRGRARDLTKRMIEEARNQRKKFVFALSVAPKMWEFFLGMGFTEVPRETLPESWKEHYDFSRPSKAFRLDLGEGNEHS